MLRVLVSLTQIRICTEEMRNLRGDKQAGYQQWWLFIILWRLYHGLPRLTIVYHGLPSSWNPMLSSNSIILVHVDVITRRLVADRSADPTPRARWMRVWFETCIRSGSEWNQTSSEVKVHQVSKSHWLWPHALEILQVIHGYPFCCLNQIQQVQKDLNENYRLWYYTLHILHAHWNYLQRGQSEKWMRNEMCSKAHGAHGPECATYRALNLF